MPVPPRLKTAVGIHRAASENWQFQAKHFSSIREDKLGTTGWVDKLTEIRADRLHLGSHRSRVRTTTLALDIDLIVSAPWVGPSRVGVWRTATPDPIEQEFRELCEQWKRETVFVASLSEKVLHPAYQRIIAMGPRVTSNVLGELEREPDHWFWALRFLTGVDAAEGEETIDGARRAWLAWGRDHGYLP